MLFRSHRPIVMYRPPARFPLVPSAPTCCDQLDVLLASRPHSGQTMSAHVKASTGFRSVHCLSEHLHSHCSTRSPAAELRIARAVSAAQCGLQRSEMFERTPVSPSTSREQVHSRPCPSAHLTNVHARTPTHVGERSGLAHRHPARPRTGCGIGPAFHRVEDCPRQMSITRKYVPYSPRSSPPALDPARDPAKTDLALYMTSCVVAEARGIASQGTMLLHPDAPLLWRGL